jgi:transaldolase/glucose-6-phosphate isomerase
MASRDISRQSFSLGDYDPVVRQRLKTWRSEQVGRRIWEKDVTVWSSTPLPELSDRLGWLNLPQTMRTETARYHGFADEIKADGVSHVVLLGMGGSSLAPEVYMSTFGNAPGYPDLIVLDSTHPGQVAATASRVDLKSTLFIVASKSGSTIEPLSFFGYFYDLLGGTTSSPGRHFVAITDPGSKLEAIARERNFRSTFLARSDVGGRYSAFAAFGLVPAALIGVDTAGLLEHVQAMTGACGPAVPEDENPALILGAVLGELARAGRDKATFIASPSLRAFPDWLEQLIAESTGKDEQGVIPVVGEALGAPDIYGSDRCFIYVALEDEVEAAVEEGLARLETAGHPVCRFVLKTRLDLAGEIFRWEMAVAAAGAALGIHPFNQPDVQEAKELARKAMADGKHDKKGCDTTVPVESCWDRRQTLTWIRNKIKPGDYIGIQAYLKPDPEIMRALYDLRCHLRGRLGLATTLGFGPRFLHSTGQLHKGGPNTGVFLQLIDSPQEDIDVPGTGYTFCELFSAQAIGDYYALLQRDRRTIRVNLGPDPVLGLQMLVAAVEGTE